MVNDGSKRRSLARLLVLGARPRTLPAAIVPVVIGSAVIENIVLEQWWRIGLAMVVSVSLQIAVNYANDYSDGIRGTDDNRVGPVRLVGSGLVSSSVVKRSAFVMLGIAALAGLVLAAYSSWWILAIGVCAMVAAWTYTGGPRPYGYAGFGELFVFIFFGIVATVGTTYVVSREVTMLSFVASIAVGCFACALLVVNNLRDRQGDEQVGKLTLAVKMGDRLTRLFFAGLVVLAAATVVAAGLFTNAWTLLGLAGCVAAVPSVRTVLAHAEGPRLIEVLGQVGRAQLVLGLFFAAGLRFSFL
jgi:1,4-dihydroxy-2-naphthoate polyprenyltransferase